MGPSPFPPGKNVAKITGRSPLVDKNGYSFAEMAAEAPRMIGNYRLYEKIGSGGMGSVHLGRLFASGGFRRIVAIKRLHPHFVDDASFVTAFLDEARLASRIHHPNVVAPLDVVAEAGEVFLVFEHVMGVSLATLLRRAIDTGDPVPPRIATAIMVNVLDGLHAAHEAKGDHGEPLGLIHRDVSPQNILVGKDGIARLLDFGIAKATGRSQITAEGLIKGKRGYMAPEHMLGHTYAGSDVYSAAVVLWELLAGKRLFPDETSISKRIAGERAEAPSVVRQVESEANKALDEAVLRGLAPDAHSRFPTAREMAIALETIGVATAREVADWVARVGAEELAERARLVDRAESAIDTPLPEHVSSRAVAGGPAQPFDPTSSEATPIEESNKRHRRWAAALLIALLLIGAVAFALVSRSPSPSAPAYLPTEAKPAPLPPVDFPPPVAPPTSEPTASASPPAASSVAPRNHPTSPNIAKKKASAGCKAYVIDKNGHTQFNEECLR